MRSSKVLPLLAIELAMIGGAAASAGCIPEYTFGDGGTQSTGDDAHAGHDGGRVDGTFAEAGGADSGGRDGSHPDATLQDGSAPDSTTTVDVTLPDALGSDAKGGHEAGHDAGGPDAAVDASQPPTPDAAVDSAVDASAAPPVDASMTVPADGGTAAFRVLASNATPYGLGFGEQTHVIYAAVHGNYWLFYVDSTTHRLAAEVAAPGGAWTAATIVSPPSLSIADGNNFSVAYVNAGGIDVVHVVANATTMSGGGTLAVDIRASLTGTTASFSLPYEVLPDTADTSSSSPNECGDNGPSVTVSPSGYVYAVTGWMDHSNPESTACDINVYRSLTAEPGQAGEGTPPFVHDGYFILNNGYSYSSQILPLSDGGTLLAAWPDWDDITGGSTDYDSFAWTTSSRFRYDAGANGYTGISTDAAAEIFHKSPLPGIDSSYDDWALCRLAANDVHLVRHVEPGPEDPTVSDFQEATFNGTTWTRSASPPSSVTSPINSGLVLLSSATSSTEMLLVTVGTTVDHSDGMLHVAKFMNGAWSTTTLLVPATANAQNLAGTGCGSTRPMVFWTDGSGSGPYAIYGADLTSLF